MIRSALTNTLFLLPALMLGCADDRGDGGAVSTSAWTAGQDTDAPGTGGLDTGDDPGETTDGGSTGSSDPTAGTGGDPTDTGSNPPPDPGECLEHPHGVGENSKLQWPTGTVARETTFTLAWENGGLAGGCPSDWSTKNGPFLGDVNGDGNLDLAADVRKGAVIRLLGDGAGGFGSALPLSGCSSGGAVDFGDFDNDGDMDILNGSHSGNGHVYVNNGQGGFDHVELSTGAGLQGAAWGDFNGDGFLDAVVGADQFASGMWIFLADGQGNFVNAGAIGLGSPVNFANIVTGDFDMDGDIDMFGFLDYDFQGLGGTPNGPAMWLNDGDGTSWSISTVLPDPFPGGAGQPEGLATGDVNCDGALDVAMHGKVFLGDGAGGLAVGATLFTHTFGPHSNFGDMDGDGHLDVVIADQNTGFRIFYGDGSGTSFVEVDAGLPTEAYSWFDLGDVDGNGNLDIVSFHFVAGSVMQAWVR